MKSIFLAFAIVWGSLMVPLAAGAVSATPSTAGEDLTPVQRKNMIKIYEQMANCLRANKGQDECYAAAHKSCESMHEPGCPLLGDEAHKASQDSSSIRK